MTNSKTPNARIKHEYLAFLKEAKGRNEASLDSVAKALHRFEVYTRFRDFKLFHIEQAKGFKAHLAEQANARTGDKLSVATLYSTLGALKSFFQWLAGQPGFKSRISYADAEYFNLSDKEVRVATARRYTRVPTLEEIRRLLRSMRSQTEIERRDRALIAFTLLTGARDGAIASFKLKHIDLSTDRLEQDAREVATKQSKTFTTWFFPVGTDVREIVADWVQFLRNEKAWTDNDPLFPSTQTAPGSDRQFVAVGVTRTRWTNAAAIRRVFKAAFAKAGLPYANPHSFRKTLVKLAYDLRLNREEEKVWSQNLGHESILTTFSSYGEVSSHRQAEIMRQLADPPQTVNDKKVIARQIAELASLL